MRARPIFVLFVLVTAAPASAQSINIDFGHPAGAPPDGYEAAGLGGRWNSFEATNWSITHSLVDIYGHPVAATVKQIGGTDIVEAPLGGPGEPGGADAALLGDALVTYTASLESCLFFKSLENGQYEVLSYGWMPAVPTNRSLVTVDNTPLEVVVGGAWPGFHKEPITFARHFVDVTNGELNQHAGIASGQSPQLGAALNGIQIRRVVAEPPMFVRRGKIDWLAALGAQSYDIVRGDLGVLRATGDLGTSVDLCLAENRPGYLLPYATEPGPGEGHWFLVRGVSNDMPLTWNSTGSGQTGDRDVVLDGAPGSCL